MLLNDVVELDYPAVVDLANLAYRGPGTTASWNLESEFIEGQRLSESLLREELAAKPEARLLVYRDDSHQNEATGPLLGTVWLEPKEDGVWYLGLLTIHPDLHNMQLGRRLLAAAEDFAKARGAQSIRIKVIHLRATLIAWYQRRGYVLTGETEPFPYGDERFGRPLRDDLQFVVMDKSLDECMDDTLANQDLVASGI